MDVHLNKIPTVTESGAETWWNYRDNGEAEWVGKAPGGDMIQLEWDSLGLLKQVSDDISGSGATTHQFTYAPSGLRIRDKRSTTQGQPAIPAHDKRFAYTTTGTLLSVWEAAASSQHGDGFTMASRPRKTDIVYANGEAVIEIVTRPPAAQGDPPSDPHDILIPPPPPENIYELHNDYLGSPRYITHGSKPPSLFPRGELAGEQAFGPYGERMEGNFVVGGTPLNPILKDLPWGYKPITGYTGHVAEDMTGLIYMRGRYYSPAWHRFVSSDHGVDPLSVNQFAYVNGSPFMARDPYGMETCVLFLTIFYENNGDNGGWIITGVRIDDIVCRGDGEEGKGKDYNDPDCIALRASGMTKEQFAEMKILWDSHDPFIGTEAGSLWVDPRSNPRGSPIVPMTPTWTPEKGEPALGRPPNSPNYTVLAYLHIHPEFYFPYGDLGNSRMRNELGTSSARDREVATEKKVPSYIGDVSSLFVYRPGASNDVRIMGGGWWEKDCF